jgi:hypothetical protein
MGNNSYDPKTELKKLLSSSEKQLFDEAKKEMQDAEDLLSKREWRRADTNYARSAVYELDYWTSCTADAAGVKAARKNLRTAMGRRNPPSALAQDEDGSFGPGTKLWFLKLDRSTDQILAREWPWPRKPIFLQRINDPDRMVSYLQNLCWSDIARCGVDNRKELNLAISLIARLIFKGGQAGYLSGPGFYPALERFILDWQDPATGFFGVNYIIDDKGNQIRTTDLSLTFHVARYVPHLVRWWPKLIDTLLAIKNGKYPQGWTDGGSDRSDHNNYDVVQLFYRAWNWMEPRQREGASAAVKELLDWCLDNSVNRDGRLAKPDGSDPISDSYYYAAAFLNTIGYFDNTKRFWTADALRGDPKKIRAGMIAQLKKFNPYYTEVDAALVWLGAREPPWISAVN